MPFLILFISFSVTTFNSFERNQYQLNLIFQSQYRSDILFKLNIFDCTNIPQVFIRFFFNDWLFFYLFNTFCGVFIIFIFLLKKQSKYQVINQGQLMHHRKSIHENSNLNLSSADLAVILSGGDQTFLINKKNVMGIQLFEKQFLQKQLKVCILNRDLDANSFQKVMKCLSGIQCKFQRNQEVIKLLQIMDYIKAKQLMASLINDMLQHFDEYSFFILFRIGQIFQIPKLKHKCLQQLLCMEFQQFNFNRYELLQCSTQTFQYLLKMHHYFKEKKIIKGQDEQNIQQIIDDYCLKNSRKINIETLAQINKSFQQKIGEAVSLVEKKFQQGWAKFRTPSFDFSALAESINFGKTSSKQIQSPTKLLKKTSDSISLHQNQSNNLHISLQQSLHLQDQIERNFSTFCELTQNKFLSSHQLQKSVLSDSSNSIQSSVCCTKTPVTPVTPDTPETPKDRKVGGNQNLCMLTKRKYLKYAISLTE